MKKPQLWLSVCIAFIISGVGCKKDKSSILTLTAQSARDMYVSVDIKPKNGTRTPADVNDHVLTYAKDFTVSEGDSVFFQLGYSTVYRATYSLKLNNKDITQPNRFTMANGSTIEVFFSYRVPGK